MTLKVDSLIISAELPDVGKEMPVFKVRGASLEERRLAIDLFSERLELGKVSVFELGDSLHYLSEAGEMQFYRPSGALWARSAAADKAFDSEIRPWETEEMPDPKDETITKLVLTQKTSAELADQSRAILEEAGLSSEHAFFVGIELDQIAELDEEGSEIAQYAGEATARFLYKLEDVAVDGAGAKSYIYFNPGDKSPAMTGAFHSWRDVLGATAVQMPPPEAILDVGLTKDQELALYHEKGSQIELTVVDLVYYAMPAFAFQELVFPALRVVGRVFELSEEGKEGFEFARFFHATPPEAYAEAGLFADYLAKPL